MTKMPVDVEIILSLHLLAALAFLISVLFTLGRKAGHWIGRKVFSLWSALLNGAAMEIR